MGFQEPFLRARNLVYLGGEQTRLVNQPYTSSAIGSVRRIGWEDKPDLLCSFLLADTTLRRYCISHLIRDAHTGCSGAKDDHAEIAQCLLGDMEASEDSSQRHAPRSLNVIVEARNIRAVLL